MTLSQFYTKVKQLDSDKIVTDTMEEAAPLITDMQKEQMLSGKNREGKKSGRYRNPSYARMKNAMNPIPGLGVPDLRLTGEFYLGVYTEIRGDKVILDSTDEKTPALALRFGESIFGLSPVTKVELIKEDLRPLFIRNMRRGLGL